MDYEDRSFVVNHEHDLKELSIVGGSPHQEFLVVLDQRIRSSGAADDFFRLFRVHSVPSDVLFIPLVPSELHHKLLYM